MMGWFKKLFGKMEKTSSLSTQLPVDPFTGIAYYVYIEGDVFGPFSLEEIKQYPLLEDTMITTNTLGGEWYEAKYFECFADMFENHSLFRILEDGTIVRE